MRNFFRSISRWFTFTFNGAFASSAAAAAGAAAAEDDDEEEDEEVVPLMAATAAELKAASSASLAVGAPRRRFAAPGPVSPATAP